MFRYDEEKLKIEMTEKDFGITLPIEIENGDTELDVKDKFVFKIFKEINGETIIEKTFENIKNKTIKLKFTQMESEKLKPGYYFYDIDWFQDDAFLLNIVAKKVFKVTEKAGA